MFGQAIGDKSLFREWSLGIVTQDKPFGIDEIMVSPTERITDQVGNLSKTEITYTGNAGTSNGEAGSQSLSGTAQLKAIWVPNGDNHLFTSPMVYANETVMLYKYADKPDVYWNTIFREPSIRRKERFIIAAGNLTGGTRVLDLDSTYYMDFNALDKWIEIGTTQSDGEAFAYRFRLDPSTNSAYLTDNIGNRFEILSDSNNVALEDASGARFESRDGHPKIFGPKGIDLETPAMVRIDAGRTEFRGDVGFRNNVMVAGTVYANVAPPIPF